jgi:hypothetical protein
VFPATIEFAGFLLGVHVRCPSSGRAERARLGSRAFALRTGLVALMATAVGGCFNGHDKSTPGNCPNLPAAVGLIGQADYTGFQPNPGGVTAQGVSGPVGSVTTNGGLFYVADTGNNRILGYSGVPTTGPAGVAGPAGFVLGQADFVHNAPGGGASGLSNPTKVSAAVDGTLVIADTGNNRVILSHSNNQPSVVVGQTGFVDAKNHPLGLPNQGNLSPSSSSLNAPTAAVIANGKLVVVDKGNNRVLIWNTVPTGNGAAADVELGQAAASTTQGNCTSNGASSSSSSSSSSGSSSSSSSGGSSSSSSSGSSSGSSSSSSSSSGSSSGSSSSGGSSGSAYCFTTNVGDIDKASTTSSSGFDLRLNSPSDIWTDGFSDFFVSDTGNNRVLYWNGVPGTNNQFPGFEFGQTTGSSSGGGNSGFGQNAAGGTAQKMSAPWGVYSDGARLFVADVGNNRVLVFTGIPPLQNAPLASGVFGQEDFTHLAANDDKQTGSAGTGATEHTLFSPSGVYVTPDDQQLFVSDRNNNRILQFAVTSSVNGSNSNTCP